MNAYAYQAALWCEDCIAKVKEDLTAKGLVPGDPGDDNTFDSDDWPKFAGDNGGGEADCAQHCDGCHCFLKNDLTSDGVEYVLDSIRESIERAVEIGRAQAWDSVIDDKLPALKGQRHVEIVRSWALHVQSYGLERDEAALVDLFLELSEPPAAATGAPAAGPAGTALDDFIRTVEATGGIETGDGFNRPAADPDWIDLGDCYVKACLAAGKVPMTKQGVQP